MTDGRVDSNSEEDTRTSWAGGIAAVSEGVVGMRVFGEDEADSDGSVIVSRISSGVDVSRNYHVDFDGGSCSQEGVADFEGKGASTDASGRVGRWDVVGLNFDFIAFDFD